MKLPLGLFVKSNLLTFVKCKGKGIEVVIKWIWTLQKHNDLYWKYKKNNSAFRSTNWQIKLKFYQNCKYAIT